MMTAMLKSMPTSACTSTPAPTICAIRRSEERRVGKECRSRCDWSSDVCSSDLHVAEHRGAGDDDRDAEVDADERLYQHAGADHLRDQEIGRASCRERV